MEKKLVDLRGRSVVFLDEETYQELDGINSLVNRNTAYRTDLQLYDKPEFWTILEGAGAGDCEDYALTKMKRLEEAGWPRHVLRPATCWCEPHPDGEREYHAVLTVDTSAGTLVLDNRFPFVMNLKDPRMMAYKWHRRKAAGSANWVNLLPVKH